MSLRPAAACVGSLVGYRCLYVQIKGRHRPQPVTVRFSLTKLSAGEAFEVIRNPRLLDETTPGWFRLVIRKDSEPKVEELLQKSTVLALDSTARREGTEETSDADIDACLQLPMYLRYWMLAFCVPFPWTSKVTHCGIMKVDEPGVAPTAYQLTYEQHIGPFLGGFSHTHHVKQLGHDAVGSIIEDVIEFDVTSEPIVNTVTWYVLDWLLRGRCRVLNDRYGGEVLN